MSFYDLSTLQCSMRESDAATKRILDLWYSTDNLGILVDIDYAGTLSVRLTGDIGNGVQTLREYTLTVGQVDSLV